MKEIVITPVRIKKELITLLVCFLIGFFTNVFAIFYYKTGWGEIITSISYVLLFTLLIYFLWTLFRIIVRLIIRTFKRLP